MAQRQTGKRLLSRTVAYLETALDRTGRVVNPCRRILFSRTTARRRRGGHSSNDLFDCGCTRYQRQKLYASRLSQRIHRALGAFVCAAVSGVVKVTDGCYIHGADIGYCESTLYTDSEYR